MHTADVVLVSAYLPEPQSATQLPSSKAVPEGHLGVGFTSHRLPDHPSEQRAHVHVFDVLDAVGVPRLLHKDVLVFPWHGSYVSQRVPL